MNISKHVKTNNKIKQIKGTEPPKLAVIDDPFLRVCGLDGYLFILYQELLGTAQKRLEKSFSIQGDLYLSIISRALWPGIRPLTCAILLVYVIANSQNVKLYGEKKLVSMIRN